MFASHVLYLKPTAQLTALHACVHVCHNLVVTLVCEDAQFYSLMRDAVAQVVTLVQILSVLVLQQVHEPNKHFLLVQIGHPWNEQLVFVGHVFCVFVFVDV